MDLLAASPELEFVIDGTERRINGSQDRDKRDKHYRGNKRRLWSRKMRLLNDAEGGE